jgi:hypothetical protein
MVSAVIHSDVNLYSIKPGDEDDLYFVPATSYGQAVEKFKQRLVADSNGDISLEEIDEPAKVVLVCSSGNLIMPSNYDIDS